MTPYNVYPLDDRGVPRYSASSLALGASSVDIAHIVEAHGLAAGDVLEVDGDFLVVLHVERRVALECPGIVYEFLGELDDATHTFAGVPWGPSVARRLRSEAMRSRRG